MDHVRWHAQSAHHAYAKNVTNAPTTDRVVRAELAQYRYSITVETQDDAVLFCLRALWQYAERRPMPASDRDLSTTGEWRLGDGRVTFRFSNPYNRGDFLGEATRLLAGKWTRLGMSDDDAPLAFDSDRPTPA